MSHLVTIQTEVRDPAAMAAACARLGLPPPQRRTVKFFQTAAAGLAVQLPSWKYPVICDHQGGKLHYDNYGGAWGPQMELDRFLQAYACEKAKLEARRQGHTVTEQPLGDGSIQLTIHVQGGVA